MEEKTIRVMVVIRADLREENYNTIAGHPCRPFFFFVCVGWAIIKKDRKFVLLALARYSRIGFI